MHGRKFLIHKRVTKLMSEPIAGQKRPLEEPSPPAGAPSEPAEPASIATGEEPKPATTAGEAEAAAVPTGEAAEEAALQSQAAWLKQQNAALQAQLSQLQQQHAALTAAANAQAAAAAAQQPYAAQQPPVTAAAGVRHNQAWTEQVNPENGQTYYWNSQTSESTYVRPHDFNPGAATATTSLTNPLPQTKGPPGANLFVVRKMRRGEYDEFNDEDLRREFSKHGEVTRAEMTIDKENGWSKGFGFVSYATVEEADAAIAAVHGSWIAGREMKVEKTHDN